MPAWVQQGVDEYAKRLPKSWRFCCKEFAQAGLSNDSANTGREREADALLGAIPDRAYVIALDNRGDSRTTEQTAERLQRWQELGKDVVLLIGGPDGLHERCRQRSDECWSLSPLTFPHPMVRVILVEQLYRAHSLLLNHPYHRA
jgi:23S rRNA (pseudouridine1915-N3)-methyltransferase